MIRSWTTLGVLALLALSAGGATAATANKLDPNSIPCCAYKPYEQVVWYGTDSTMTIQELAAYCGPILWFSPDEPSLDGASGADIRMPTAFPFETAPASPVVYYRLRRILARGDLPTYTADPADRSRSVINLAQAAGLELDFFYYYPSEEGFGGHAHDVESTEMKISVWQRKQCKDCPLALVVHTVNCKAHGVQWYDNTLDVDTQTRFPMTVLVEEGKHATCTDKNGDGYYTPGYDVNRRVNDAWGIRDVIRGGALFSGGFESWFAKVRKDEDRIFPPLPADSPLRQRFTRRGEYAANHAQYELRPFPRPELAAADPKLVPFIEDKGDPNWPDLVRAGDLSQARRALQEENFVKSVTFALRMDGEPGISVVFPLFIVKNYSDPLSGGWLVNRVYFMDKHLRDFGYNILYTTSASRWIDGYFSVGFEADQNDAGNIKRTWTGETGFKFRANIRHSPLKFMSHIADFWGMRVGLKSDGLLPVTSFSYVVEIGGGTF